MLYYIAVKASIAKKNIFSSSGFLGAKFFAIILLIVLFFNLGSAKAQVPIPAANVNFDEFACLFTKTDNNGKCTHNPDAENIKTGAESGVVYGKTNSFTDKGITSITMQLGLWADIEKEKKESKYHFSRVADQRNATFLLRLKYEPVAGYPVYKLIDIPYQEDNVEVFGNANIRTINMDLTKGSSQVKIGFYKLGPSGPETVTQQVINAVVDTKMPSGTTVEIPFGATISADFWYCAGEKQSSRPSALEQAQGLVNPVDGRRAPKNDPQRPDLLGRVEYFTADGKYTDKIKSHDDGISYGITKCDGTAYFKIGETITFKLPESREAAQADSQKQLDSGIVSSEYIGSVLPLCSIDPFTNGSVMGCVAQILYGGVFRPVAFFAQLMGQIFDFFLGYSLSDESYRHDFIQTGWQLVRDISNIFFIIIMVWSGLIAVFNTKKASYKQVIPTLIINALIINFSLFATRIVIDLSNITARIFYNQMVVKVGGEVVSGDTGFKPISEAIVSSFNPQSIFRNSVLQSEDLGSDTESGSATSADFNSQSKNQTQGAKFKRYSREYASYFALVTLLAIMITFSVAVMFWKTAFIFVGRVVGLYVAMIFSPFAFLSRGGLPLVSKIPSLNFGSWWGDLYKYALVAPIFVFFLYIINAFLNVEFFQKVGLDQNGQGFFGSVMYVLIPMLIIYTLVTKGVKVAETFAGDIGKMASSFGNRAAGFVGGAALGVASGGLAFAGTRTAGMLRLSETKRAELLESKSRGGLSGRLASLRLGLNDRAQSGSFDLRKSSAFTGINKLAGGLGVSLKDNISNKIGLSSDATKGGMKAIEKKEKEALKKKIESIKTDVKDEEAERIWNERSKALIEKAKQKLLNDEVALIAAHRASGKDDAAIEAMKNAGTLKNDVDDLAKKKVKEDYGNVKNNKQLTQALRLQFAETISEGKTFGQSAKAKVLKGLGVADAVSLVGPNALIGAASTPISAGLLMTGIYDSARSSKLAKEEAKSYAKKAREAMNNKNKLPKEERLENQKKEIEKDLESIDATLKKIFEAEIAGNPIHSGKTAQDFFNNSDLASEAIKKARKKMRDDMSTLDIDIELFKEQHHNASIAEAKARAEGKISEADEFLRRAKEARDKMVAKNIEKSEIFQEHKDTDPEYKQKKQADLNKKDDELEKIKEKAKKDSEGKDDKK